MILTKELFTVWWIRNELKSKILGRTFFVFTFWEFVCKSLPFLIWNNIALTTLAYYECTYVVCKSFLYMYPYFTIGMKWLWTRQFLWNEYLFTLISLTNLDYHIHDELMTQKENAVHTKYEINHTVILPGWNLKERDLSNFVFQNC